MSENGKLIRIWLEVANVQLDTVDGARCKVQLKADKEHPEPLWWPVGEQALGSGKEPLDTYKQILYEIDKKRVVLAGLTWDNKHKYLHCHAFRFQSAELGSR